MVHRSTLRSLIAATTATLLLVSGCSFGSGDSEDVTVARIKATATAPAGVTDPATSAEFAAFYGQKLAWKACGDDFECTRLTVPVDWAKPAGETLQLAVARLPAARSRIGSLVINPGGPGVSGVQYARVARQAFGRAILANYDVVGFDPRGVENSSPIECLPNSQLDGYVAADATPDTPSELASSVEEIEKFADACEANTGDLLEHVDTLSTARDVDVLRAALGDSQLSFFGASYGTFIGAWYAQTFPWRVGRLVLDGAVDPESTSAEYSEGQARGFSRALAAYTKSCLAQDGCPLRGSVAQGLAQIGDLVDDLDGRPMPTNDDRRDLTQALMVTGIAQALYSVQVWPVLTAALTEAMSGDGTEMLALADQYYQRDAAGKYSQTISANPATFCLDSPETRTPEQIEAFAQKVGREYPPLGENLGWGGLVCSKWPVKAVLKPTKLTAEGAAPILVVGTVNDPATPYEWAQGLAGQLSSGRLLTWEGDEHTAYHRGVACIDDAVEAYLLAGTLPADGTRCAES